jgi:hypothetical protein
MFGLCGDHGDVVGPSNDENCSDKAAHEAFQSTKRSLGVESSKWAGVLPIAESVGIALGVTSNHGDESEDEKHKHEHDLATRKPELCLSDDAHGQGIEETKRWESVRRKRLLAGPPTPEAC